MRRECEEDLGIVGVNTGMRRALDTPTEPAGERCLTSKLRWHRPDTLMSTD
jgi:hypothetical protein